MAEAFGKGVNDYLNLYVTFADVKAGAFLTATLTVGGLALGFEPASCTLPGSLRLAGLGALAWAAIECSCAVYPRLPHGSAGLIFWEDIRTRPTVAVYTEEASTLDAKAIEAQYAAQNWYVSRVVHAKFRHVQRGMIAFGVGATFCILAYLLRS